MNRNVSSSKSRRQASGPSIQWLDADVPSAAEAAPAKRTASGLRILPAPERGQRLGWVEGTVLLVATLGIAAAGFVYVSARLAGEEPERASTVVEEVEPVVQTPPEAEPVTPPPSDTELAALETGAEDAMADALSALRTREVTPAGLRAVAIASRRTVDVELQRRAVCYRVRGGAPLAEAFSALPTAPPTGIEWATDGSTCLIESIAARAGDAPERALPLLLDRAYIDGADSVFDGLAQLNLPVLPVAVVEGLAPTAHPRSRRTAMRLAIALGAASKWPDQVANWLEDQDRSLRLFVHGELLRRHDEDAQRLAARAIAANPADDELARRGLEQIGKGEGFDRQLAALAADTSLPAAVRAHAADLVGSHGGPAACRMVVSIASGEPELASELAGARLRIDQRFGEQLRQPILR